MLTFTILTVTGAIGVIVFIGPSRYRWFWQYMLIRLPHTNAETY